MPYLVLVREEVRGNVWRETTRDFPDGTSAIEWAREMYDGHDPRKGSICVSIYSLIGSLN